MSTATLPTHAGPVRLNFNRTLRLPERLPGLLNLPARDSMECHSLKSGEQLLVHYPQELVAGGQLRRTFFAGQDESAFCAGVEPHLRDTLVQHGEAAFFDALKPAAIKRLEKLFPGAPVCRQGDIWAIKLPLTWRELREHTPYGRSKPAKSRWQSSQESRTVNVLGVEHTLTGRYHGILCLRFDGAQVNLALCEGTLSAPDHADKALAGGPHALARTPHLMPVTQEERQLGLWH